MSKLQIETPPQIFADTQAAIMLREALARLKREKRVSARSVAHQLGYKQPVVLSHMASGRVAIPLERATEIARAVDLPPAEFLAAAVSQRNPEAIELLVNKLDFTPGGSLASLGSLHRQLEKLAGSRLDDLSDGQKMVLREVVLDRQAERRWLTPAELPVMLALRDVHPNIRVAGLPADDLDFIEAYLFERG